MNDPLTQTELWTPLDIESEGTGGADELVARIDDMGPEEVGNLLTQEKGLVFRGFEITPEELDRVLDRLLPNRLAYVHGNSPRTKVGSNVYTSTEYPQEFTISMHNEMSYAHAWPARLAFYCQVQPGSGGATPVLDAARWLDSLDAEVREAFAGGVRYVQNLHDGFGLGKSWQDTFETTDRAEVEAFLEPTGARWEWKADGGIRVASVRPATTRHPVTGAEVWFNQSDQWHPAGLGDDTAAALAQILPEEDLPQNVTFADGTPIPAEYVVQIRDRGLEHAVDVDWRSGDLLLIDNVLLAHGRRPFTGARRVLVAMSD
ncbi:alpha-ketoglutarate-dependent taurine dioxygenase [Streptomyces umbrinus]|uniref:Alpha-ketoglutarate-dependent taurine dioxygenase n=1 Tax=Streptomyces umbrinus TaxID=67370 RepID=A0ABU0STR9_9ACTN|nr:TauD/TfdA family dioxygenase [Streptomyces umbrinus]MDQ1026935.1 alpha-ketoglutarate-dependent taurine dioxygenase [Streptomyces umbrinus]